ALSAKALAGDLVVVDAVSLKDAKTATLAAHLGKLKVANALIIAGAAVDEGLARAARNLRDLDVLPSAGLNVYDILRRQKLVLSRDAVEAIHARFRDCKPAKTRAEAAAGPGAKAQAAPKQRPAAKQAREGAPA